MKPNCVRLDLRPAENAFTHRRLDHRGTYDVHPNAAASGFKRGGLGQSHHAVLARAVGCETSGANQPGYRRHVHDGSAPALLEHLLNLVLQTKPCAFEIDVNGAVPILLGLFGDRDERSLDPGIVERDIQAAKLFYRFADECLNISGY